MPSPAATRLYIVANNNTKATPIKKHPDRGAIDFCGEYRIRTGCLSESPRNALANLPSTNKELNILPTLLFLDFPFPYHSFTRC